MLSNAKLLIQLSLVKMGRRCRLFRSVDGNGDDCWAISVDGNTLQRDRLSDIIDSWFLPLDRRV
jgi:hypothetical protein